MIFLFKVGRKKTKERKLIKVLGFLESIVTIPSKTTSISSCCFGELCKFVTEINFLPDSKLTEVYKSAFTGMPFLKQIRLPDSLEFLDPLAFEGSYIEEVEMTREIFNSVDLIVYNTHIKRIIDSKTKEVLFCDED